MKIAFVGVKRKYKELDPSYVKSFNRFHLELPYYYARDGKNSVVITTVDHEDEGIVFEDFGTLRCELEENFVKSTEKFDVVIHWRKWFPEFYRPEAINVINCQDHSFLDEWKKSVSEAFLKKKLYGILCFPEWHKKNLHRELYGMVDESRLIDGLTLGVDTDIYKPSEDKNPYEMLWASDPGRGLNKALELTHKLFSKDKRFRLNICRPDYSSGDAISHPAFVSHGNIDNGPKLWELFAKCGILPYTSTFMEPSSRAHRQAMAAGCLVLYPPGMGTPSDLIQNAYTGITMPEAEWPDIILRMARSDTWRIVGKFAREYAISENWSVQANRFNKRFKTIVEEKGK